MVNVNPDIIEGTASFNITLKIICVLDAPNDLAASTTPGSTSFKDDSIILATKGAAAIVKGTIAAGVPIDFPTINFVNGIIATIKIKNGNPLNILIIVSKTLYIILLGFNPFGAVTTNIIAGINPNISENNVEKKTMAIVLLNAGINISDIN